MTKKRTLNHWAEEDRPREKLMTHGASCLSNAELLAIIIGSGNTEDTAVELMRKVLDAYDNKLSTLSKCTIEELCRFKGIGVAKAVSILATAELGRRRKEESQEQRKKITSSADIYAYFHPLMCDLAVEESRVLLLNPTATIIDSVKISRGGIASTLVDVRCVLREALLKRATSIILCHNHPSGNNMPSTDDDRLTIALHNAAQTMDIRLLDHVILCDGSYYSYSDNGRTPFN